MKENARQNLVLILVGNKNDCDSERQVSKEEGLSFMKKNSISLFFETSAKTGENIDLAFQQIGKLVFLSYMGTFQRNQFAAEDRNTFSLGEDGMMAENSKKGNKNKNGGCC